MGTKKVSKNKGETFVFNDPKLKDNLEIEAAFVT